VDRRGYAARDVGGRFAERIGYLPLRLTIPISRITRDPQPASRAAKRDYWWFGRVGAFPIHVDCPSVRKNFSCGGEFLCRFYYTPAGGPQTLKIAGKTGMIGVIYGVLAHHFLTWANAPNCYPNRVVATLCGLCWRWC
jgi:hypothetical protein